jgi:hypothetical protein
VDNTKGVTGASAASTESLDPGEVGFFKLLDEDAAITEEDTKAEANIVHGFDSHRSAIVP